MKNIQEVKRSVSKHINYYHVQRNSSKALLTQVVNDSTCVWKGSIQVEDNKILFTTHYRKKPLLINLDELSTVYSMKGDYPSLELVYNDNLSYIVSMF